MKHHYLFYCLFSGCVLCSGNIHADQNFAERATSEEHGWYNPVGKSVKGIDLWDEMGQKSNLNAPQIFEGENRTIYGVVMHNPDFQYDYGISKLNSSTPSKIDLLYSWVISGWTIYAGAAANGVYYGFFYRYDSAAGPIPESFSKINLRTGEFRELKDWSDVKFKFQDMTYDYSTQTMYGLGYELGSYLYTIDLETGEPTQQVKLDRTLGTLAASYEGTLYGIDINGVLYQIDKETGGTMKVLDMQQKLYSQQSMEFDHTDGSLYWASDLYDSSNPELINQLFKIDVKNKTYKSVGVLGGAGTQMVGLYIPYVLDGFDAPGLATELTVTPGEKGKEIASLTWNNPTVTHGGAPMNEDLAVTLMRDGKVIGTGFGKSGEQMSWEDKLVTKGEHIYTVYATNSVGAGAKQQIDAYVGPDVPEMIKSIQIKPGSECKSILIQWTAPLKGTHDGYFESENVRYTIKRYPDNVVVAENYQGLSLNDESIRRLGNYHYGIIAVNEAGASPEYFTDITVIAGKPLSIPYSCEFNDPIVAQNLWSVADANNDGVNWYINSGFSQIIFMDNLFGVEYIQNGQDSEMDADEWLISPPLYFEKDKNYSISFETRSLGNDELSVTFGDLNTPASQRVIKAGIETEDSKEFKNTTIQIPKSLITEGVHCFGINLVTRYGDSGYFQITNIGVQENSANNLHAVDVSETAVVVTKGLLKIEGAFNQTEIFDVNGRLKARLHSQQPEVSTAEWVKGVYIVKVTTSDKSMNYKTVIE